MRAFLVLGPESSGTRLMTSLLIAAGCYGDDGHEQRLDMDIPYSEPLIVWRRSVPHRGDWRAIDEAPIRLARYKITAVLMSRDWHSMAASQVKATHAKSMDDALKRIKEAYMRLFGLFSFNYYFDSFEIVNYEALTQRPQATITNLFNRLGLPTPAALPAVYDGNAKYYQERPVSLEQPVSQLCTQSQFEEPSFLKWITALNRPFIYRRKYWEFAYIAQTLELAGLLKDGRHALGFGIGREPLAALFASRGVCVLATDQPDGQAWGSQYAASFSDLPYEGICDRETFNRLVRYAAVDMNDIPANLRTGEYDFVWSANSLDHLGSIETGLRFIHRSLDCLKPGGLAVHTTEFNTDSNEDTLDNGPVVLFREKDMRRLASELTAAGHSIELNLSRGSGPIDLEIDRPPYNHERHIRLEVGGYVTTSIGLVIRK